MDQSADGEAEQRRTRSPLECSIARANIQSTSNQPRATSNTQLRHKHSRDPLESDGVVSGLVRSVMGMNTIQIQLDQRARPKSLLRLDLSSSAAIMKQCHLEEENRKARARAFYVLFV